ncbi:MAG: hypothetical protein E7413_02140 [Ruminococcaceae bacterium]|nr:hypothetical protein [Oscillospiraceae bacterium]
MREKKAKNKNSKKKKWWIILLILLVLSVVLLIGGIHFYRHNQRTIDAIRLANQEGEEGLEQKQKELTDVFHETVLNIPDSHSEILNERDHRKLKGGDLTPEQTAEIFAEARKRAGIELDENGSPITNSEESDAQNTAEDSTTDTVATPQSQETQSTETNQDSESQTETSAVEYTNIDALIEDFYVLKSKYLTGLEGVLRQGKNEWRAKPKSEHTLTARFQMAQKCMSWGTALEVQCDAEMNMLLAELESALIANGESTALVGQIRSLYEQEKSVKRAALIGEYYPK